MVAEEGVFGCQSQEKNGRQSQIVFQGGRTNYVTVPIPYFFRAPV